MNKKPVLKKIQSGHKADEHYGIENAKKAALFATLLIRYEFLCHMLFYFYGDHRDIVVRFFGLDEFIQAQVDAFDDFFCRKMCAFFQDRFQAPLIK
jgi:hypothetical protein